MRNLQKSLHSSFSLSFLVLLCLLQRPLTAKEVIPIGVVLDLNSSIGSMAQNCISMAISDFYRDHAHYKTRISPLFEDSQNDVVAAASSAYDLIKNKKVHAIVGPQRSGQARFVMELGRKFHVPIISFSATSPSLSSPRNPFFIRTAQDDCSQVQAIAAIVKAYGWREIIPIYEDTEYGNGLIPYLNDAFEAIDTRVPCRCVIDPNAEEPEIKDKLKKLKEKVTKVFLVHMTAEHASKLFSAANEVGMMMEGYAWIVTEGLSAVLDPMDPKMMNFMQGILGVKPMVPDSKRLEDFKRSLRASGKAKNSTIFSLFGLWAYDTIQVLAMAIERVPTHNLSLLQAIQTSNFHGLSGDFNLVNGTLEPSVLEIFNLVGNKERIIGYWNHTQKKLVQGLGGEGEAAREGLKPPLWPGDTIEQPPKLRIGVPVKRGFNEFIKLEGQLSDGSPEFSGFVIDLFKEVTNVLPFPLKFKFFPFQKPNGEPAGTYDELLIKIRDKKLDAVVGDVTVVAHRLEYVDFTLPYSETGVSMVVPMKHDERRNMWIFLKPLSCGLWLTTGGAFILTGFIIWFLEHRSNMEFRGTREQQLGTIFWFSFSTLVFAHKEKVVNNWSRFVLIIWIFVVLIITQSYTASLASMLTVARLQPAFIDVKEIKKNNYSVGYQNESFVKEFLMDHLGFEESKLKGYETPEEYDRALSRGSNNDGVAAIFDEIPYMKIFLQKYGSRYAMVGPTYKTGGLSFAFPQKSPLVSYFSRAILNVTEEQEKFEKIKNRYFSSGVISEDQSASINSDSPSLTVYSFAGLFIITVVTSLLSLIFYFCNFLYSQWPSLRSAIRSEERSFWSVMAVVVKHFDRKDSSLHPNPPNRSDSRVHPSASAGRDHGASIATDGMDENQARNDQNEEANDVTSNNDDGNLPPEHGDTSPDVPDHLT